MAATQKKSGVYSAIDEAQGGMGQVEGQLLDKMTPGLPVKTAALALSSSSNSCFFFPHQVHLLEDISAFLLTVG